LRSIPISTIQWTVISVLLPLILITTALVRIGRPAATVNALVNLSIAIASFLTLLMVNERPLAAARVPVTPVEFRRIALN
jgi:hypothetical protein